MSFRDRLGDRARRTGRDLRVAVIGAGQMGRGFTAQLARMDGVTVSAVADIDLDRAAAALHGVGIVPTAANSAAERVRVVDDGGSLAVGDAEEAVGLPVDMIVEATGVPDAGARICLAALLAGKDVATLNVEADVTVGLLLRDLARAGGALYSVCRGDEPTEIKRLVDYARDLSFEVVCAGKGKNNPFRAEATPDSCAEQAAAKHMSAKMLCSFVDGSKAMIEMAALANTTGLAVSKRGMHGPHSTVEDLSRTFALAVDGGVLERGGVVDYCTGPVAPGVFVVVRSDDPYVTDELRYLSLGQGPYFHLYRPFHLASVEAPLTVYEMALDRRPSLTAEYWTAEVAAAAKRDLAAGERIDGIGGFTVRGVIDDAAQFAADGLVPLGVLAGARVVRDIPAGALLTYDDVELSDESAIVSLRRLQDSLRLAAAAAPVRDERGQVLTTLALPAGALAAAMAGG